MWRKRGHNLLCLTILSYGVYSLLLTLYMRGGKIRKLQLAGTSKAVFELGKELSDMTERFDGIVIDNAFACAQLACRLYAYERDIGAF